MGLKFLDLDYFFEDKNGQLYNGEGIGAVTLITPVQMITVFNIEDEFTKRTNVDCFASGSHLKTREEIIKYIYDIDYSEGEIYESGDVRRGLISRMIEIRYVNSNFFKMISVIIPSFINKEQYYLLSNLNEELKEIQKLRNFDIKILVSNNGFNPNNCIIDSQPIFWDNEINNLDNALVYYKSHIEDIDLNSFPKNEKLLNFKSLNI